MTVDTGLSAPVPLILIADDNRAIRELIAAVMIRAGFAIEQVGNGTDALERIRALRPVVAVLDLRMPGLSGFAVANAVKRDPDLSSIGVVIVTASAKKSEIDAGLASGADEYVTKPFSPRHLVSIVEALIARKASSPT